VLKSESANGEVIDAQIKVEQISTEMIKAVKAIKVLDLKTL